MILIFTQVAILFAFASIGFSLCKAKIINSESSKFLSNLVVWLFLPATTFKSFSTNFTIKYITEKYDIIITSTIAIIIIATSAYFFSKILTKDKYTRSVYTYSFTVPSNGYIGIPLTQALFGPDMLINLLSFTIPINIYLYTIGYCSLTKAKLTFKKLLNPPMFAMVLGAIIGLSGLTLPDFVTDFLSVASSPLGPCTMLILGMVISEYKFGKLLKNPTNYIVILFRLILIPTAFVSLFRILGLTNSVMPALIAYSMPCGLNTVVFPKLVGEDCETGAALALVSTALSMATIPFMFTVFGV